MKNKIVYLVIFILSLFFFIKAIPPFKEYMEIKKGNRLFTEQKYSESREIYEKTLNRKENIGVRSNILKSFYNEKNYKEVVKYPAEENFLKGNSQVYLGNEAQEKEEEYKKALELYKKAMLTSDDINIKKNYELTLKKLKDIQNQNNSSDKQNKENQNSKQNKNNNSNQENKQNSQDSNSNQDNKQNNQDNSSSQDSKQKQNDNNSNQDNKQNNQDNSSSQDSKQNQNDNNSNQDNKQNNQGNNSSSDEKQNSERGNSKDKPQEDSLNEQTQEGNETRKEEIRAILKRLEGNEKQSFKNNERVMDINSNNPTNRW